MIVGKEGKKVKENRKRNHYENQLYTHTVAGPLWGRDGDGCRRPTKAIGPSAFGPCLIERWLNRS